MHQLGIWDFGSEGGVQHWSTPIPHFLFVFYIVLDISFFSQDKYATAMHFNRKCQYHITFFASSSTYYSSSDRWFCYNMLLKGNSCRPKAFFCIMQ